MIVCAHGACALAKKILLQPDLTISHIEGMFRENKDGPSARGCNGTSEHALYIGSRRSEKGYDRRDDASRKNYYMEFESLHKECFCSHFSFGSKYHVCRIYSALTSE
jgi:hypothetical protein